MDTNWLQLAINQLAKAKGNPVLQKVQQLLSPSLLSPVAASAAEPTPATKSAAIKQAVQAAHKPTQAQYTQDDYKRAIEAGFQNWGNPPAATLSAEFAKAPGSDPIYQQYPFLLPTISLLETSGGAREKQPNNLLN